MGSSSSLGNSSSHLASVQWRLWTTHSPSELHLHTWLLLLCPLSWLKTVSLFTWIIKQYNQFSFCLCLPCSHVLYALWLAQSSMEPWPRFSPAQSTWHPLSTSSAHKPSKSSNTCSKYGLTCSSSTFARWMGTVGWILYPPNSCPPGTSKCEFTWK